MACYCLLTDGASESSESILRRLDKRSIPPHLDADGKRGDGKISRKSAQAGREHCETVGEPQGRAHSRAVGACGRSPEASARLRNPSLAAQELFRQREVHADRGFDCDRLAV